jgi:succinyl-CoA synthetase alpha subunit
MSILVDRNSRVLTQGMTGRTGQFHTRLCREYGFGRDCFVGGVNPKKAGEQWEGLPIYGTVQEGKDATGANVSVIYVPPAGAANAIIEASDAGMDLIVCITEGIPILDMVRVREHMRKTKSKSLLLGPNCPGILTPGEVKIGIMPAHIHTPGRIGVVSRSGTLTYEAAEQLTRLGYGQSTVIGIGGDPVNGIKHVDALRLFNEDPNTDAVVMIGEIGGSDEETAAEWARDNMTKPVVGFIAGVTAPEGKRMGHAGAIIRGGKGTAAEKIAALEACGIRTTRNPSEIGLLLKEVLENRS